MFKKYFIKKKVKDAKITNLFYCVVKNYMRIFFNIRIFFLKKA